jgi:hypothetical protein
LAANKSCNRNPAPIDPFHARGDAWNSDTRVAQSIRVSGPGQSFGFDQLRARLILSGRSVRVATQIEIGRPPRQVFDCVATPALWHTAAAANAMSGLGSRFACADKAGLLQSRICQNISVIASTAGGGCIHRKAGFCRRC